MRTPSPPSPRTENKGHHKHIYTVLITLFFALVIAISSTAINGSTLLFLDILSVVSFLFHLNAIRLLSLAFFYIALPFNLNYFWFAISTLLLENGAFTPELRIEGIPTGATARLTCFFSIFLAFAALIFITNNKRKIPIKKIPQGEIIVFYSAFTAILIAVLSTYAIYGTAFSNFVDRIVFKKEVTPPYFAALLSALTFSFYFFGSVFEQIISNKHKLYYFNIFLGIAAIVLIALSGEKASAFVTGISLFMAGRHSSRNTQQRKIETKAINWYALTTPPLLAFTFIALAVRQYLDKVGNFDSDILLELLRDRLTQQGQLNYASDKYVFYDHESTHLNLHDFFFQEILPLNTDISGIKNLMFFFAPGDLFRIYTDSSVTFGDGFPGLLYIYFGAYSFLLAPLLGSTFGLLLTLIYRTATPLGYIYSVALIYLTYNSLLSSFLNSDFWIIFDITYSKILGLVIVTSIFAIKVIKKTY